MAIDRESILSLLHKAFDGAAIELIDHGDGDHYDLSIKYNGFAGLSKIQQHKAIYNALGSCVGNELHALSIKSSS